MPARGSGGSGTYSYSQLMQLWIAAGGSRTMAPIMAAIAMAESGGNPRAHNASGASGLWQILGAVKSADQSRLFDPTVNAREAVLKFRSQGLGAWESYTNGSYKKFMQKGASGGLVGAQAFVKEVEKFIGTPYVWGGASPRGFDCSGLVEYALQQLGIKNVPRTSEAQYAWTLPVPKSKVQPGDLVFFAGSDGTATSPGHVAIYVGNGQIVQAPHTGADVDKIPLSEAGTPVGYGRIPGLDKGTALQGTGGGGGLFGIGGAIGDVASALSSIGDTLSNVEQGIAWFFVPNHWVRIFCGLAGAGLVLTGIITMTRTGRSYSVQVPGAGPVPAPGGELAPALGIAEVTLGSVLLFVAFHNLPSDVTDVGGLISHLQQEAKSQGKAG